MAKGWIKEPRRHSLASKGIKTAVNNPKEKAMMRNTNSVLPLKQQRENYEKYLLESIDNEGYEDEEPLNTPKEKLEFLKNKFRSQYGHEIERKGERKAFEEWISGLPSIYNIEFQNYEILKLAKRMGSLQQNPTEKQEDRTLENYWNYITNQTFRLFDKYEVN